MDEQTDSGHGDMPFEFTTNMLPFDPPSTAGLSPRRPQPRPDALDFDALTVEPHERELKLRSRFETASEIERPAASMAASPAPAQPIEDRGYTALSIERREVEADETSVDDPFPKLFDFDPDAAPATSARRGVLAMAGVTCVALFMTGVSLWGNDARSTTAPVELARRDAPVEVRSGVADQAFEYTISGYELDTEAVEPIVVEVCGRLADGEGVDEVELDARQRLFALAPDLGDANADAILRAGVEAHCMEHLLTIG